MIKFLPVRFFDKYIFIFVGLPVVGVCKIITRSSKILNHKITLSNVQIWVKPLLQIRVKTNDQAFSLL